MKTIKRTLLSIILLQAVCQPVNAIDLESIKQTASDPIVCALFGNLCYTIYNAHTTAHQNYYHTPSVKQSLLEIIKLPMLQGLILYANKELDLEIIKNPAACIGFGAIFSALYDKATKEEQIPLVFHPNDQATQINPEPSDYKID